MKITKILQVTDEKRIERREVADTKQIIAVIKDSGPFWSP